MSKSRPIFHKWLVALSASVLASCATGPAFQSPEPPPPDRGQLYVYRPMVIAGGGVVHKVRVDGGPNALSLPNASWQRLLLTPGRHRLAAQDFFGEPCGISDVDIEPGQTRYVEDAVDVVMGLGRYYIVCKLIQRTPGEALKVMPGLSRAALPEEK